MDAQNLTTVEVGAPALSRACVAVALHALPAHAVCKCRRGQAARQAAQLGLQAGCTLASAAVQLAVFSSATVCEAHCTWTLDYLNQACVHASVLRSRRAGALHQGVALHKPRCRCDPPGGARHQGG